MAKRMTDEEIREFINSKNISQDSYVAPTVKTHVDTRNTQTVQPTIQTVKPTVTTQPTFNQFSQTNFNQPKTYTQVSNKPSFLEGAGYIGNAAKTGLVSGFTGIPNSALQETERALKKGENIKNTGDVLKQILNSLSSASNIQNPFASFLSNSGEYINNLKNIWSGNENTLSKLVNTGLEATSQATKATGTDLGRYADMVYPFVGAVNPNLDEKISQLRGVINQPAQQMQQELQQEGQKFGAGMNMLASGVQSATNMAPSLLASAATGNPDIGLTVMLNNARGQATEEALREGKSLDEALKIGNAKGLVEYGTERMTGGINLLGKGALDDVAEKWVNDSIKGGVKNFLAKQGLAVGGEMLEEITSDLAGTLIDKGTVDPNKTYTWNDLLNTIGPTAISTILVNALTGGYGRNAYRQNLAEITPNTQTQLNEKIGKNADVLNLGKYTQQKAQNTPQETQKVETRPIAQETQKEAQMANKEVQKPLKENIEKLGKKEYNITNETERAENDFRTIQEESRRKLNDKNWGDSNKAVDEDLRGRIRGTLSEEIKRRGYSNSNNNGVLKLESKGNSFNLYKNVDPETFHDMFEIARTYTDNGELVDLHPIETNEDSIGYNEMNNYISDDGMQGFSITKDGDVVSVFNADPSRKGFLRSAINEINKNGKTLDCYNSSKQRLDEIYSKVFGWKVASVMDHNIDYDHDNIAKNHNNPPVSFMINPNQLKSDVTDADLNKKFGKDQYDEAVAYRNSLMKDGEGNKNDFEFGKDGYFVKMKEKTPEKGVKLKEKDGKYTREDVVKTAEQAKKQFENKTLTNKKGKKISNFYSNITEKSQFIEPETREKLKTEDDIKYYKDVTNEQALNEAVDKIGTTPASQSKALHEFLNKQDQFTATDMAEGWVFLKQYQDAGNYDAMAQVAKKMREMGTKSGQAIQMLALEARLTPEGMYRFAVNELAEAEQKFNSEKGRKQSEIDRYRDNFQLTPEETDFIKTQMEKVQNMEPGRERDIEVAKINKMLSDKLPHEKGRSLKAWMRLSMLFNPKTQVRNVMGNALITPVNALADITAGLTDRYVSKKTGVRTIGGPSLGGFAAYGKGALKGLKQATQDYRLGLDTKNLNQNRFDIGQGKAFNEQHKGPFKNVRNAVAKGLNATNDLLGYVMDAGDRMFYQGSVENSLYNQQKLNNTNEVTQEMADIAVNEGLQRTWNDDNQFTQAVLNIRRAINDIGGLMHIKIGEYGLGDLMIPFAKTPANLTKAIVDYSPVGFLNAVTEGKNLKRAIATGNYTMQQQHDFAQTLGKATAGSLLYALGIALAKAKITSGSGDEDKDLKNFMRYNLGIQPYSIKIGDKSFTYDWAQPVAAPLAITADIEKGITENMTPAQAIQQFLTTGFNVLSEQSFLSGVNEVLNDNDGLLHGIEQQVLNMPATAVPTLLKQFTDLIDPTKRQTYSKEGMTEQTKKYAMSKIPTESKKLAPQVDVLGNEIQKYGGDNNAFNVFLNPANTEKGKTSDVSEEIYALYEATGDKNIIPRKVDYSITLNGKKKILTTEEMAQWQKASGQYVTENVRKAMNNIDYQKMSDKDKAAVINKIVNYSFMKAKSETFGTSLSSYYSGVSKAEKKGIPMYDYYINNVKKG